MCRVKGCHPSCQCERVDERRFQGLCLRVDAPRAHRKSYRKVCRKERFFLHGGPRKGGFPITKQEEPQKLRHTVRRLEAEQQTGAAVHSDRRIRKNGPDGQHNMEPGRPSAPVVLAAEKCLHAVVAVDVGAADIPGAVVMENMSRHHIKEVRTLLQRAGMKLLYLPAYCPDLSPTEKMRSKIRAILRRLNFRLRRIALVLLKPFGRSVRRTALIGFLPPVFPANSLDCYKGSFCILGSEGDSFSKLCLFLFHHMSCCCEQGYISIGFFYYVIDFPSS